EASTHAVSEAAPAPAAPEAIDAPVVDVDPAELSRDPYPTYERLRAAGPVVHAPAIGRYLATTHAAVIEAEQDQVTFSVDVTGALMSRALGDQPMLRKSDPEHAAERKSINPTLRPKPIAQHWAPMTEQTV